MARKKIYIHHKTKRVTKQYFYPSIDSLYNASLLYSGTSKRLTQGVTEACATEPLS